MNTLSTITGGLTAYLLSSVLPALLSVLGTFVVLVFSVWGVLQIYAMLTGKDSRDVTYRIGRVFGDLVNEEQYQSYAAKAREAEREERFKARYKKENKTDFDFW